MKKILITGGCGFIGTKLVYELLKQDCQITVVDTSWFGNFLPKSKKIKFIKKDIRNLVENDFKNIDTVFHLASISNDPCSDLNPKLSWEVGPLATFNILNICKSKKIRNFIYASSGSVYGVSIKKRVTENTNLLPISDYNKQKMITEKVIESFKDLFRIVIIRPATVCGISPRLRLDLSVNMLTYQAAKNKLITVFGGDQIRPNIHIDDMVSLYLYCYQNKNLIGTFNAGFENISILDIAKKIQKKIDCKIKILKSNDPRSYRLDSSKILKKGFKPLKSVEDAIDEGKKLFSKKKFKINQKNLNLKQMLKLNIQ
tara:strand:+ start:840 stop:1781 length:942 start_codon:yes stop_codon:yes gene_type:complete